MNKVNEEKENPMKNQLVTKEQIRKYLRLYPTLQSRIRQWELYHIRKSNYTIWESNDLTLLNFYFAKYSSCKFHAVTSIVFETSLHFHYKRYFVTMPHFILSDDMSSNIIH